MHDWLELLHLYTIYEVLLKLVSRGPRIAMLVLRGDMPVVDALVFIDTDCIGKTDADGRTRPFRLARSSTAVIYIKVGRFYHQVGLVGQTRFDGHLLVVRLSRTRERHAKTHGRYRAASAKGGTSSSDFVI